MAAQSTRTVATSPLDDHRRTVSELAARDPDAKQALQNILTELIASKDALEAETRRVEELQQRLAEQARVHERVTRTQERKTQYILAFLACTATEQDISCLREAVQDISELSPTRPRRSQ